MPPRRYGLVPVGNPTTETDRFKHVAVWVFLVHPATMSFLSFLLVSLFLTAINENHPWRPMANYFHIPALVFVSQVCCLTSLSV